MTNLVLHSNRIGRELDNWFDSMFGRSTMTRTDFDYVPRVNIVQDDNEVRMTFELAGMKKEDVKVVVHDSVLTVSGERVIKSESNDKDSVRSEIRSGSFSRSFTLPDSLDSGKIAADYANGLLELVIPKAEEKKPKEIEVKIK